MKVNRYFARVRMRIAAVVAMVLALFCIGQATPGLAVEQDPAGGSGVDSAPAAPDFEVALADYTAERYAQAVIKLFAYIEQQPPPADYGKAEFLLGLTLLKSGGSRDAVLFFAEAEKHFRGFEDVAALYLAKAHEAASDFAAAAAVWERAASKYPSSPFFADGVPHRARLLSRAGSHEDAARLYESIASNGDNEWRYMAAEEWAAAGRYNHAARSYRLVLDSARVDRFTNRAFEAYEAVLKKSHDGRLPTGFVAYAEKLAEDHWKAERYRQAQPPLASLVELEPPGQPDWDRHYRLGISAFYNHDNDTALRELEAVASSPSPQADDALYRLGKTRTRLGDNEGSRREFKRLMAQFPKSGLRRSAVYQIALIDMEDNDYEKAFHYFDQRLKAHTGTQEEYLTWLKAWTAYRAGKLETAETTLTELLEKFKKSGQSDRYRYWRAAVRLERKKKSEALEDWRAVNQSSATYYGLRSAQRLEQAGVSFNDLSGKFGGKGWGSEPIPRPEPSDFPDDVREAVRRAITLERLGCHAESSALARRIAGRTDDKKNPPENAVATAQFLQMTGHYYFAKRLALESGMYSLLRRYSNPMRETYWPFIYPRAWEPTVRAYAASRGLSEELVYSIMYNESQFKPWVVSPANAIGLMQIVPRTAEQIAGELGDTAFQTDDLYSPETNIRYGTWYLRQMLDRFDGNQVCAVASYNAGPDVVGKWWRNKGEFPEEIFIEEIPYKETNLYVKKVLLTLYAYRLLYGGS